MARLNSPSGKGGGLLDNGVAALAALSAGFVTYAMPEGLFARLILATHLPSFVAAAQPPLGMKARLAVVAAVAVLAYAAVWTLMRALDSIGGAPRPVVDEPEEEAAPRLRRADAHPDAPSRRPILAGRDLGEPFDDEEAPFDLEPESAIAPEPDVHPQPWHVAEAGGEPEAAEEPWNPAETGFHEPPAFEPERAAQPSAAPAPVERTEPLPSFLVPQQPEPESAQPEAPAPAAFVPPAFDDEPEEGEEEEEGAYEADDDSQSLARLMQRFESGLGRKQPALQVPPPAAAPEPDIQPAPQERVGHRLRSAISDLGKISAPGR